MREPRPRTEPEALPRARRIPLGDPGEQRSSVRTLMFVITAFVAPYLAFLASQLLHLPTGPAALIWLALAAVMNFHALRSLDPPEATVGADGISIRSRGKATFIPLGSIERVRGTSGRVDIRLRGGEVRQVRGKLSTGRVRELVACLEQAMRARDGLRAARAELALLERRGRSLAAWREDLRRATSPAASYREPSLARDDVAAALTSPDASPEHRIGAALALADAGGPDARRAIRIAAEACANQPVRAALGAIAAGEPDAEALEEALAAEASPPPRPLRARRAPTSGAG